MIATSGKPLLPRAAADDLIPIIIREASAINLDTGSDYRIGRLAVFGSYLTYRELLGDLDIAVEYIDRETNLSILDFAAFIPGPVDGVTDEVIFGGCRAIAARLMVSPFVQVCHWQYLAKRDRPGPVRLLDIGHSPPARQPPSPFGSFPGSRRIRGAEARRVPSCKH